MKEFLRTMTTTWWGILIICVLCVAVWILLSALLYRAFFKRFYDMLLSGIAVIVLSPLLLFLIILGALEMHGNPFFVQQRPGRRKKLSRKECAKRGVPYGTYGEEKIFKLIKFRTMTNRKDADGNLLPDSERLTRYGKFLRATSLDELPELFNIFIGNMSIVGPRPLLVKYLPYYTEKERHRHDVSPGLTGLAQVNGRNYISWEKIFEYDLIYAAHISLINDLKIIFKTAYKVVMRKDIDSKLQGEYQDCSGHKTNDAFDVERSRRVRHEIGSDFWQYDASSTNKEPFVSDFGANVVYFKSGRNAIKALCELMANTEKKALLPIYTCDSVIEPFLASNWQVDYYDINKQLVVDKDVLFHKVEEFKPNVVLLQSYFGFNTLDMIGAAIKELRERGITIVEDITHSLFSEFDKTDADFYVSSLRKFFAIPNGGMIATSKKLRDIDIMRMPCDACIDSIAKEAFELKRKYIECEDMSVKKEEFRKKYVELNELIRENSRITDISQMSMQILKNVDKVDVSEKRRKNYNFLYDNKPTSLCLVLNRADEWTTPLYFPIYLKDKAERDDLQKFLAVKNIYCPILWPLSDKILSFTKNAEYIYAHILCIPIDQRYDTYDMQNIINAIDEYMRKEISNG